MSLNTNVLNINKEYSIYVPTANLQYKYALDITADYIDLYDVPQLESNHTYTYIRVYFDRPRFSRLSFSYYWQYLSNYYFKTC